METTLKIYLPIFLIFNFSIIFLIPTYRTWKKTGINPITFGKQENANNYIGNVMKSLILILFFVVFVNSFLQNFYQFLVPIHFLNKKWLIVVGLVLIHITLIWIGIAQHQMGKSWRIGIDDQHQTPLVSNGIFRISRNPIFLGMIVSLFGIFLILPNVLTFFLTFCTFIVIQIQIRLEEVFLAKQHGEAYLHYKSNVSRFIYPF